MRFLQSLSTLQCLRTILVLVLSLGIVQPGGGQRVGFDVCSCAPSQYEFQFDFSLFCPPINITQGDAVVDTSCLVSPFQDQSVGDLVPIAVQEITVMELDQNLDNLFQLPIRGSFNDGDTFTYTSVAAQSGLTDPMQLPRGIQFNIVGINILEQPIINQVIITFSNDCQAYPVLIPGQYAGWVRFLDLQDPLDEYCNPTSEMPSAAPSPFTPVPTTPDIQTPAPTDPDMQTPSPTIGTPGPTLPPPPPTPTPPPIMSMSMNLSNDFSQDIMDLLEDEFGNPSSDPSEDIPGEFGLPQTECTDKGSSTKYTKKSRGGKSGKGGSTAKETKKMGKGGAGKGRRGDNSSSMMTDPSLSRSHRLLRSKGANRIQGDCGGKGGSKGGGKAAKKTSKSGNGGSMKVAKSVNGGKGSKKMGSSDKNKISKKESSSSRRFIL